MPKYVTQLLRFHVCLCGNHLSSYPSEHSTAHLHPSSLLCLWCVYLLLYRSHAADNGAALPRYRIFAFDLETTGFNHTYDTIIEMAIVDVASGACWSSLVKPVPWKRSHKEALAAHGAKHTIQSISHLILPMPAYHTNAIAERYIHTVHCTLQLALEHTAHCGTSCSMAGLPCRS